MHYHWLVAFVVLSIVLAASSLPRFGSQISQLARRSRRLQPGRLDSFSQYFDEDTDAATDATLWQAVGRLRGTLSRVADLAWLFLILQTAVMADRTRWADARRVYRLAALQLWFTAWAVPEAALCFVWRDLPHICARAAAGAHLAVSVRTHNICLGEDIPRCVGNLY